MKGVQLNSRAAKIAEQRRVQAKQGLDDAAYQNDDLVRDYIVQSDSYVASRLNARFAGQEALWSIINLCLLIATFAMLLGAAWMIRVLWTHLGFASYPTALFSILFTITLCGLAVIPLVGAVLLIARVPCDLGLATLYWTRGWTPASQPDFENAAAATWALGSKNLYVWQAPLTGGEATLQIVPYEAIYALSSPLWSRDCISLCGNTGMIRLLHPITSENLPGNIVADIIHQRVIAKGGKAKIVEPSPFPDPADLVLHPPIRRYSCWSKSWV